MNPSVAQLVERLTVVVDTVLGILGNQLVTSSILVVRTLLYSLPLVRSVTHRCLSRGVVFAASTVRLHTSLSCSSIGFVFMVLLFC